MLVGRYDEFVGVWGFFFILFFSWSEFRFKGFFGIFRFVVRFLGFDFFLLLLRLLGMVVDIFSLWFFKREFIFLCFLLLGYLGFELSEVGILFFIEAIYFRFFVFLSFLVVVGGCLDFVGIFLGYSYGRVFVGVDFE